MTANKMALLNQALNDQQGVLHRLLDMFEASTNAMREASAHSSMDSGTREAIGNELAHQVSAVAKVRDSMDILDGLAFTEPPIEDITGDMEAETLAAKPFSEPPVGSSGSDTTKRRAKKVPKSAL